MSKLFGGIDAGHARVMVENLSIALVMIAGCTRAVRQPIPARVAPVTGSESRPMNTMIDSTREYSGEWESGFETSIFRGCNGIPTKVRISLAPGASEGAHWTENSPAAPTTRTYYVRVRGILRAPQGKRAASEAADYELYVTRVLEVKPRGQPNCIIRR